MLRFPVVIKSRSPYHLHLPINCICCIPSSLNSTLLNCNEIIYSNILLSPFLFPPTPINGLIITEVVGDKHSHYDTTWRGLISQGPRQQKDN